MAQFPPIPKPSLEQLAERNERQCSADFSTELEALQNKIRQFEDVQVLAFSHKSSDVQAIAVDLLSARLTELMLSAQGSITTARYSSALVLLRAIVETLDLLQFLSFDRAAAEKWRAGSKIKPETTQSAIYLKGELATQRTLYDRLCDVMHANESGLGAHKLWAIGEEPVVGHSVYNRDSAKVLINFLSSQVNEAILRLGKFLERRQARN